MQDSTGDVAVFWDLDTCSLCPTTSGYDVVGRIRLLSQKLGMVRSFKGYADLANLGRPSALHLRSELQSSGVSLIDCPATEHRSISSKTMIVDILAHAADHPPPTTLLVISGNDDFSYAVSILQLRQYQVVLICPKDRVGQHSQASLYLDWFRDVLGSDSAIDDDQVQSSRITRRSRSNTTGTISTVPGALEGVLIPESLDTRPPIGHPILSSVVPIFREDSDGTSPQCPDRVDAEYGEDIGDAEVETVSSVTADDIPQSQKNQTRLGSPVPSIFVEIQHRPSSAPPSYSSFSLVPSPSSQDFYGPMASGAFDPPQYPRNRTHSSGAEDDLGDSDFLISQPQSPGSTSASTVTPWNKTHPPDGMFTPPPTLQARLSPDLSRVAVPLRTSQEQLVLPPSPSSFAVLPPLVQTPNLSPQMILDPIRPSSRGTPLEVPPTSVSLWASQTTPATPPLSQNTSVSLPVPPATSQPTSASLPIRRLTPVPTRIPMTPAPTQLTSVPLVSIPQSAHTEPPTQVRPPAPKIVPPQFKQLVKKLQERREKGDLKPFRPGLAAEMVSVLSGKMQEVGASTFTQFAQLAEQAGIVELPRPGEGLWIALRPELYQYHDLR